MSLDIEVMASATIKKGTSTLFELQDDILRETLSGFKDCMSGVVDLLEVDGNFSVPFTAVDSPAGYMLISTEDFDLSINGLDLIQIRKGKSDKEGNFAERCRSFQELNLVSLDVVPKSDLTLIWVVWGDPIV